VPKAPLKCLYKTRVGRKRRTRSYSMETRTLHTDELYYCYYNSINDLIILILRYNNLLLPILIPQSGVGTTCFYHVVIKIRHLFLRPAACLTSTLLETGVDANDCKYSREQQLNVPSEAQRSSR
jgi:hypothetical protein